MTLGVEIKTNLIRASRRAVTLASVPANDAFTVQRSVFRFSPCYWSSCNPSATPSPREAAARARYASIAFLCFSRKLEGGTFCSALTVAEIKPHRLRSM